MGSTLAEKILANHSGKSMVKAGDIVVASIDFAMIHDARASSALKMIEKMNAARGNGGNKAMPFASRTALVLDHHSAPVRMSWARMLKRVFDIDMERCACGGQVKVRGRD